MILYKVRDKLQKINQAMHDVLRGLDVLYCTASGLKWRMTLCTTLEARAIFTLNSTKAHLLSLP